MEEAKDVLVLQASYTNPVHAEAICLVLNGYAQDPMGGGRSLPAEVLLHLPEELAKRPYAFSVLGFVNGEPAGLVNCFEGFSTFACRPLVNIHDVVVMKAFRGLGLSQKMLQKVEDIARQRGCCKITLEVLEGNAVAQASYSKFGFSAGMFDPAHGRMLFWTKPL
ncbi:MULTISPECIES: GNAT family N-acetyltransferase [unclassified Pseudomonas]|uniref:GNAT family N-acetyltransferase n=1 Tax=unclassified Pseudomonas TaxID=196821 RepID=UPI00119A808D|nr:MULTISPECIES: GNAT family N-acetyltransferase [unclassified Pseudomonas]TWC23053.1 acetyltransferase (GNAT) family protein [Pseudomonas sp. SJZ075]TWC24683.1 acetyltransferase (GNAT) family protein [Pseudomonas sp. SJZ074]TWC38067.1 acetyltransferase (GNAT) family protein [Pseudomonas sp. SJZ078]TWC41100.1 acetyltransferase (GNAT) family protein [Pseudomonas sp. SJZ085]TWC58657.1 acetyltransferase (GNAT) family protein [Pseudomonas sp. SJZ124]